MQCDEEEDRYQSHNICPKCGNLKSQVLRTDTTMRGTRRRRKCQRCNHRWSTREVIMGEDNIDYIQLDEAKKLLAQATKLLHEVMGRRQRET